MKNDWMNKWKTNLWWRNRVHHWKTYQKTQTQIK